MKIRTHHPVYQPHHPINWRFSDKKLQSFTNAIITKPGQIISALAEVNEVDPLTPDARVAMLKGTIPYLLPVCNAMYHTVSNHHAPFNAKQFLPELKKVVLDDAEEVLRFIQNPVSKYVLIHNEFMKMVLIHWRPGDKSSIHGHPDGGCVFKVLKGKLEETRYSPDEEKKIITRSIYRESAMTYIDNALAYHAVGNPYNESAISLHVYTPGNLKQNSVNKISIN